MDSSYASRDVWARRGGHFGAPALDRAGRSKRPSAARGSLQPLLRRADPVGLQLPVQVAALDAETLGGAGHVPLVGPQLAQDEGALEGLARLLEGALAQAIVGGGL